MKYVRFASGIHLFPAHILHRDFALQMGQTPISAGEIDWDTMTCHGESISLNLKSLPEDTNWLRAQIQATAGTLPSLNLGNIEAAARLTGCADEVCIGVAA